MPGRPTTIDATTALPEPAGTPPDDSWTAARGPFWHVVRAGTALGWLLLVAAVLVTGERVTSVEALLAAAAEGDVDEVRVAGVSLPPGARGIVTQEVHWSDGGLHYLARIVQAHPAGRVCATGPARTGTWSSPRTPRRTSPSGRTASAWCGTARRRTD